MSGQATTTSEWSYGGSFDLGYLRAPNDPSNHLFRSRGTTFHLNEVDVNMATLFLKHPASANSRLGMQLTLQAGKDTEVFGFSASAPNLGGSKWLRHLGPTNVSYLAPIGNGLLLQGGIFLSFVGYDALYAKHNFTYTRPWGADFTPYFMLGGNAQYPLTKQLSGAVFLVNGYWHPAHANDVPSSGAQLAYQPTDRLTVKTTALYGPHQGNTSLRFWRFLSDNIIEWKTERFTVVLEGILGTERVDSIGTPRQLWLSSQLPIRYIVNNHFSVTVRPEVYWDRDGRTTLYRQTVKANSTTLEYRASYKQFGAILRLEHRIDNSGGPDGGFFKDGEISPGVPRLTSTQNLLILAAMLTFESIFKAR